MIKLIYDSKFKYGIADCLIEEKLQELIEKNGWSISQGKTFFPFITGTALFVNRVRLAIAKEEIPFDQIQFWFNDELIPHRPDGTLTHWPKGFCDHNQNIIKELTLIRRPRPDPLLV